MTNLFADGCSTRLAGKEDRVSPFSQSSDYLFNVGRFSTAFASLERDECAFASHLPEFFES